MSHKYLKDRQTDGQTERHTVRRSDLYVSDRLHMQHEHDIVYPCIWAKTIFAASFQSLNDYFNVNSEKSNVEKNDIICVKLVEFFHSLPKSARFPKSHFNHCVWKKDRNITDMRDNNIIYLKMLAFLYKVFIIYLKLKIFQPKSFYEFITKILSAWESLFQK